MGTKIVTKTGAIHAKLVTFLMRNVMFFLLNLEDLMTVFGIKKYRFEISRASTKRYERFLDMTGSL